MIMKSVEKSRPTFMDRGESPLSTFNCASTTYSTDCLSQQSDHEEQKVELKANMPVVFERGESVWARHEADLEQAELKHVTDDEFNQLSARLTDKCNRQRAELNKAKNASNKAQAVVDACREVMDKIDNFTTETPRELQREFNVIAYGANHTVDKRGNVTMYLKDAHSKGGIVAMANQAALRRQKMEDDSKAKRDNSQSSARAARDARAASRDRSFHQ